MDSLRSESLSSHSLKRSKSNSTWSSSQSDKSTNPKFSSEQTGRGPDNSKSNVTLPLSTEIPVIRVCKQSQEQDVKEVLSLANTLTQTVFGEVNITDYVEKGICRSLFNEKKELVAFIAVQDHPNLSTLAHCNWQGWLNRYYRINNASSWNSLFIHYLVWDMRYPDFFPIFLKHFYKSMVQLKQIIMVLPPGMEMFNDLWEQFTCVYPSGDGVDGNPQFVETVHLNLRPTVLRKLLIRKAGEEDNIDVQPILHSQYEVLKHVFGGFKLSSVIDLESKEKAILVAENAKGVTVGVLALTSAVDYQHINDYFYVPLEHFTRADELRDGFSKLTARYADTLSNALSTNEDLFSLAPDILSEGSTSTSSSYSSPSMSGDRSMSTIYLDDDDSEFRIVDPAMHYIMLKKGTYKRMASSSSSTDSLKASQCSFECNTYYGRPSYSINVMSSPEISVTQARHTLIKDMLPAYIGPEDGFTISMFALHPDLDVRFAFDLLEASFECYLNKTYCLLSLPTNYQGSPLIKHFVRLTPRLSRDFPHELYFVHRNSIFSEFKVRSVSLADLDGVAELIENLSQNRKVRKDLTTLLTEESSNLKGYILECESCIVGVAIVLVDFMLDELQPHFRLEKAIKLKLYDQEKHGMLRHAIMSVMFLTAASFFLRQVMHQSGIDTLGYCLYPRETIGKYDVTIPTVLGNLRPVLPRERIIYNMGALDIYTPKDFVVQQEQDFAFFITTEKLLNVTPLELNYRIVVVGASNTALSFLENLIYSSAKRHIRYNNIILVSFHGFPAEERPHKATDRMLPHSGRYTREFLSRLSLQTHINILYGAMTSINRTEKMISMEEHWLRYDYLFLFTGTQYCKPVPASVSDGQGDCRRDVQIKEMHSRTVQECGDNIFLINTTLDASVALKLLKKVFRNKTLKGKIIVHGNTINIYTCVEALLAFGVPGNKIVMVESADVCKLKGLDTNSDIERAVIHSMQEAGVTLHHGFSLINWTLKHRLVQTVMFRTATNVPLTLDCLALFCYSNRSTSFKTYLAITNSGLVYNNGIIINNKFLTNDPFIFAAGPGTKYSSHYKAPEADHVFCSSLEVGKQVSRVFRRQVEPWPEEAGCQEETTNTLPQMKSPITLVARLPGGWNYFRLTAPGTPLPLECQLHGQGECGPVLITGDPVDPEGPGYFQLSLSSFNTVREIACLSKHEIPYQNLERLYGHHEKLLNNLLERFNYGLISDLFAFFSEPWSYALYTTGFDKLVHQCVDIFKEDEEAGLYMLGDFEENHKSKGMYNCMSDATIVKIGQMHDASSVPLYVQNLTLKYLSDHTHQLPMYMTDQTLAAIQRGYTASPLHRDPHKSKPKSREESTKSTPIV